MLHLAQLYISCTFSEDLGVSYLLDRKEAVALVKESGNMELIQPTFVVIAHRTPDKLQLRIKGDYNCRELEAFLRIEGSHEENKDYLIIFKV